MHEQRGGTGARAGATGGPRVAPAGRRLWAFRGILLSLALISALGIAELAVRVAGLAPTLIPLEVGTEWGTFVESEDPLVEYEPKPGAADFSSYGIRDREYPLGKPDGVYRIVVIGDSFGFGLYLDDYRENFSERLEGMLAGYRFEGIERVEVINLSVSGYDSAQQVAFLARKGVPLEPDLVLVSYCLNDDEDSSYELSRFREHESWAMRELRRGVFEKSHLARLMLVRAPAIAEAYHRVFDEDVPPPAHRPDDRVEEAFDRLRGLADDHDFEVLIAVWPHLVGQDPYPFQDEHDLVHARASAQGFAVFDLKETMAQAASHFGGIEEIAHLAHPTAEGHAAAAYALAEYLTRHNLKPSRAS